MTKVGKPPVALIAGPTASGKSALALRLAEATGGAIINADSAQVYRDLPILSAAPSCGGSGQGRASALRRARRRPALFGRRLGRVGEGRDRPASCRGTDCRSWSAEPGFIFEPSSTGSPQSPTSIQQSAPKFEPPASPKISRHLTPLDPVAAATLNPGDTTRIARALEVVWSTGKTLGSWQEQREGGIGDTIDLGALVLIPPRPWLYERCDRRFQQMVEQGALEEVEALLARGLNPDLPVMRAIGVAELGAHLTGELTLDEAVAAGTAGHAPTMPSANIPGSRISRRPNGRASTTRLKVKQSTERWRCSPRQGSEAAWTPIRDADIDPTPLAGQARRHPRLWQSGPCPGAQPEGQRDRRHRRPSRRFAQS